MLILQGILPLLAYVIAESYLGVRKAVVVALVLALIEFLWFGYQTGQFDKISLLSMALIVVMGGVSYTMNSPLMIKLQPVVLGVGFAAILAYFQIFDEPLIFKMYPTMKNLIPAAQFAELENPETKKFLGFLCGQMIGLFLVHAALVGIAAFKWNRWTWLGIRSLGMYPMVFLLVVVNVWLR